MQIANGSTDVTTYFVLRDSTNHAPKTDVTVTDLDLYYVEAGAAISAKADATALAAADSAHSDNTAFHVGQGLYRVDWPDAAFDGGIGKQVTLIVVCTGVDTTFLEVELSAHVNANSITAGAVNAAAIADNAIDAGAIATGAITADKIADAAIDIATFAADAKTGSYLNVQVKAQDNIDFGALQKASLNAATPASIVGAVGSVAGNVTGSVGSVAAGGITAASIATDAIDDDALAANAVTAIQSGLALEATLTAIKGAGWTTETLAAIDVLIDAIKAKTDLIPAAPAATGDIPTAGAVADAVWDEALAGHAGAGSAGAALSAASAPTAAAVADAVWDEALAGHAGAGSAGATLSAAGGAADPLLNAVPGTYAAGTAGEALGYIDDIKAKTDLITTGTTVTVVAAVTGDDITILRGDSFSGAITGLGSIAARTKLWFALKTSLDDADTAALAMVEETAGLQYLNGAVAVTATDGDITIQDAALGNVTIVLKAAATAALAGAENLYWDIQMLTATGVTTLTSGRAKVTRDVVRATS